MNPPRRVRVGIAAAEDPLAPLISAVKAGRLFALLKGEGLNGTTVRELLRPESAEKLRAVLTEGVFSGRADSKLDSETRSERVRPDVGRLLVFKGKERHGP